MAPKNIILSKGSKTGMNPRSMIPFIKVFRNWQEERSFVGRYTWESTLGNKAGCDDPSPGRPQSACPHGGSSCPRNVRRLLADSVSGWVKALPKIMNNQGKKGNFWGWVSVSNHLQFEASLTTPCQGQARFPGQWWWGDKGGEEGPPYLPGLYCLAAMYQCGGTSPAVLRDGVAIFMITWSFLPADWLATSLGPWIPRTMEVKVFRAVFSQVHHTWAAGAIRMEWPLALLELGRLGSGDLVGTGFCNSGFSLVPPDGLIPTSPAAALGTFAAGQGISTSECFHSDHLRAASWLMPQVGRVETGWGRFT